MIKVFKDDTHRSVRCGVEDVEIVACQHFIGSQDSRSELKDSLGEQALSGGMSFRF